jgi:hypothetical protein
MGAHAADLVCLYAFQDASRFLKWRGWHWALGSGLLRQLGESLMGGQAG